MMKYVLSLILLIGSISVSFGQGKIYASDASGNAGDIISVDITVDDFANLYGFQFIVTYDPTKLRVRNIINYTTSLKDYGDNDFSREDDQGIILTSFFDLSESNGFTLANGSRLFTVEFEIIAASAGTTNINIPQEVDFGDYTREIEVVDNNFTNIGGVGNGGVVTIGSGNGGGGDRIKISLGTAQGQMGETVCIPMTVQDFNDVVGMQYSIRFDTDLLEFVEAKDFNLTGFSAASITTEHIDTYSSLAITWNTPSTDPTSVPDGQVIANFCFRIKGSSGESAISFSSNPVAIEVLVPDGNGSTTNGLSQLTDGRITVGNGGGGGGIECNLTGFYVAAEQVTSPNGSNVCVNFVGNGINKLGVLETAISWDNTILSNPSIEFVNIDGDGNNYNLAFGPDGYILLSWVYNHPDFEGATLPDGSVLFKVCFDVIGSDGQSTDINMGKHGGQSSHTASDINNNRYNFQVCKGRVTVGVAQNISVSTTPPTCFGDSNGSIDITVNSGQAPYTYEWKKEGSVVSTSEDLNNLSAGKYIYKVTDNTGATIGEGEVDLVSASEIVVSADVTPITNGNDGAIALTVTGGSGNYMYNWSSGQDTKDLSNLAEGTYTVTVTDGSGCSVNQEIKIGAAEFMVEIEATTDYMGFDVSCFGEQNANLEAKAMHGKTPYTYRWSTGDETQIIQNVGAGEYSVTVTDGDGESVSATYMVNEPERLVVTIQTSPSGGTQSGDALATVTGGASPYSYVWNDKTPGSTTAFIAGLAEGNYQVTVTDANNCLATNTARVPIDDQDCFTAALVMTPNADSVNDELKINCIEGSSNTLRLFDRWGVLVYSTTNYDNTWTGQDNNDNPLSDGVYYFVLDVTDANNQVSQYKGHVTLLRKLN